MICADFEYAPRIRSRDFWRYINLCIIMYVIIKLWKVRSAKSAGALNAANAMNGHTVLRSLLIRYDTIRYFNVRSKADISQLNLPHGTDN